MFTAIGIVPRHVESAYIDQIEYHPCHTLGRANTAERMAQYFNMWNTMTVCYLTLNSIYETGCGCTVSMGLVTMHSPILLRWFTLIIHSCPKTRTGTITCRRCIPVIALCIRVFCKLMSKCAIGKSTQSNAQGATCCIHPACMFIKYYAFDLNKWSWGNKEFPQSRSRKNINLSACTTSFFKAPND